MTSFVVAEHSCIITALVIYVSLMMMSQLIDFNCLDCSTSESLKVAIPTKHHQNDCIYHENA